MSSFRKNHLSDEAGGVRPKPRSRTSARDEELLRSLHAALSTDQPANRMVDRDTRFRIIKVEPKWRRPRDVPPSKLAASDASTPAPRKVRGASPGVSTAQLPAWPSLKQPKARETTSGRREELVSSPSAERNRAGQWSTKSPAVARAPPKKPKSRSRKKRKSSPSVPSPDTDKTTKTTAVSRDALAAKESPTRQGESKPENEGDAEEANSAMRGVEIARRSSTNRDESENKWESPLLFPPQTLEVPSLSRELPAPDKRKESRSSQPSDSTRARASPEDNIAPMPRKTARKTKVSLRSNLSVSRHNIENRKSGESTSVDRAPQPRKRAGSQAVPCVVGPSQSHAAGLALESSRYSMQELGAAHTPTPSRKHSGRTGDLSVTALVRPTEAASQASLQIATPADWGSLAPFASVGATAAASDATTSTQRAFQSAVEGTNHFQQALGGSVPKPLRVMSGACFSPCQLSPKISEAESSERLLSGATGAAGTLPDRGAAKEKFFVTASLTSLSDYSRDEDWPRHLRSASGPTVESHVVGTKRRPRILSLIDPGETFQSVEDEKTLLAPTVRRPSSSRRNVPNTADVSRGAGYEAKGSSDELPFYSASSADFSPTAGNRERFFSVYGEDASPQRGELQNSRSFKKAAQRSPSTMMPQCTFFHDDLVSNAASLNKVLSPTKPPEHTLGDSHKERHARPSVAVQTTDCGRKSTLPEMRPVGITADMSKTLLTSGRRETIGDKGTKHSSSLNASAGQLAGGLIVDKPTDGNNNPCEANAATRGDAATDSAFYTASEMRQTDQRRPSVGKQVRGEAAFEETKSTGKNTFPRPEMGHAYVNAMKVELFADEKTPSSSPEESCSAHEASNKLEPEYDALLYEAVISPPCTDGSASGELCRHGKRDSPLTPGQRDRRYSRDGYAYAAKVTANTTQNKRLSRSRDRPQRLSMAHGRQLSKELDPWDPLHGYSLFGISPMPRGRQPESNWLCSGEEVIRGRNLGMGPLAVGRRSCASSEVPDSSWDMKSKLSFSPSLTSPENRDSIHLLLFPRTSRAYLEGEELALFPGAPMFRSQPPVPLTPRDTFVPSDPSFRTARSSSEPNLVASRPRALRGNQSLSDSMLVNPSSTASRDVNLRGTSARSPSAILRKTAGWAEQRQLPKVAPKKKRPKQAVIVKPTAAETDVTSRYSPDMPYVSAAGNPGLTGVEVSMTTRSHAKELCLSMVTVSVAVLGLVLLARIAGGSLSHVGIPNLDSNASTGILLGRGVNETVYVHTTTPIMLAPPPVVCNLSRCLEDGTNIAGLLSWDSDPCVDFYDFACSRWMQARAASASVVGGASASVVEDMERDVEQRVPRLLAAARAPEFAPLRRLHDTCNDVNAINAAGWAPLAELLRICGLPHWPYEQPATISPWKAAARALQYTGAEAFMSLEVAPHPLRINRTISALDRPLLVLRPSDLAEQDVHWLEDTADTVMTAFRERPRHLARESVAMAIQIARLTYSRDALSDVRLYRVVHLGPFPQLLEFLSTLFANLSSVHASSEVLLRAEGFLRDLLDLADEHKNRALLNYVGFRVAVHSSAFLPDAGGLQAVHGRVLFPHEPPGGYVPRERLCARQVASTMPFLFFYAVRVLFGGEATVRALTAALETLRRHLAEHLSKLALTDYATRVQLVSIVKATRFHVLGPPLVTNESHVLAHARALPTAGDDEPLLWFARITAHVTQLRHMRLSRYVWRGGAFDRDCSSDLQANAVFVPPLFLNASATLDRSLLALQAPHLGARFARCLLLMLLAGVSNRGNRELVTRGWWSDTSKSALGALRRCLARPAGPDDEDDGEGSTAEKAPLSRVAEALAVPPALDAFTEGLLVLAGQGRTLRLPRVEDLTPAQLFFDYYALSRCRRGQHHWRGGGAAADEVNGALRQSAAFHEAFECARGRPMNRVAPCDLWA